MRAIKTQKGFTILETLITLAVTSLLFVSTAALISSQVGSTRFRDNVSRANQTITNLLNDVQNGRFDTGATVAATLPPGCSGANGQRDCVFAGLKIEIDDDGNLTKSKLAFEPGPPGKIEPDHTNDFRTASTEVIKMPKFVDYQPRSAVGVPSTDRLTFYILFENYTSNNLQGGAQKYIINYAPGVVGNNSGGLGINNNPPYICLTSGSRKAKIVVGSNGGALESKVEYAPSSGC